MPYTKWEKWQVKWQGKIDNLGPPNILQSVRHCSTGTSCESCNSKLDLHLGIEPMISGRTTL